MRNNSVIGRSCVIICQFHWLSGTAALESHTGLLLCDCTALNTLLRSLAWCPHGQVNVGFVYIVHLSAMQPDGIWIFTYSMFLVNKVIARTCPLCTFLSCRGGSTSHCSMFSSWPIDMVDEFHRISDGNTWAASTLRLMPVFVLFLGSP